MDQRWETYARRADDGTAEVVLVDLALEDIAPDAARPWLVTVDVPLLRPNDQGLRDPSEMDPVGDLGDALEASIGSMGGVTLGRRTARGRTTFWFHAPRTDGVEAAVATALSTAPAYTASTEVVSDPEWHTFLREVFPRSGELQVIERERQRRTNEAVLQALAREGDVAGIPRDVDHFAYLRTREDAESVARDLAARGFSVGGLGDEGGSGRKRPWRLHLYREHAVDRDTVERVMDDVFDALADVGGEYDGWECRVTRSPTSDPPRRGFFGRLFGR